MAKSTNKQKPKMVSADGSELCGYRDCNNQAFGRGVFQKNREDKKFLLCAEHLVLARNDRRNWSEIEEF